MMIDREDALDNVAQYESIAQLKHILKNMNNLRQMAEKGNQTAHAIWMDLDMALRNKYLTDKQRKVMYMKFIGKETNNYIAQEMNISETAVRKHINGALKRIQRLLLH